VVALFSDAVGKASKRSLERVCRLRAYPDTPEATKPRFRLSEVTTIGGLIVACNRAGSLAMSMQLSNWSNHPLLDPKAALYFFCGVIPATPGIGEGQ
jgi:hypothetical protein